MYRFHWTSTTAVIASVLVVAAINAVYLLLVLVMTQVMPCVGVVLTVRQIGSNTSGVYRLQLSEQRYVFIQTNSKLFKNPLTNQPEFIMSTHSIIRWDRHHTAATQIHTFPFLTRFSQWKSQLMSDLYANFPNYQYQISKKWHGW